MRRSASLLAVTLALGLTTAACGSSNTSNTTSSSSGGSSTTSGSKTLKSETIGVVGVTNQSEQILNLESAIKQGAKALGWSTVVKDGQNTPSIMNTSIQDLVNQHVGAILTLGIDADNASQALDAAKQAGIPVIATGNDPSPVGSSVFAGIYADDPVQLGQALADYAIKKTPSAKAVAQQFSLVYQAAGVIDGFNKQLSSKGGTTLATQQVAGSNVTQSLASTAVSLLRAQPSAKYIVSGFDFAPSVVVPALQNANIKGVTVLADFDDSSTLQLIRSGDAVVVAVPEINERILDALNALAAHFASGATIPRSDPAGPLQVKVIDKSNVPSSGQSVFNFSQLLASRVAKWKQEYHLP